MLDRYRVSKNIKEIMGIIAQSGPTEDTLLWQNYAGRRYIFPIETIELNERFMSFAVTVTQESYPFFNSVAQTYCRLSYNDSVFKVALINIVNNKIFFNIPNDVRTLELRSNPRQKFKPSDAKYMTLQIGVELLKGAKQALRFQVIDISSGGASLVVTEKNIKYFEDATSVDATMLMEHELVPKKKMELVYFQKFKFKSRGKIQTAYRVGLKFAEPLNFFELSQFS